MKSRKLLDKLNQLIGLDGGIEKAELKKLRKVLKGLKEKQGKLQEKLESAVEDEERLKIQRQLEVIKRQREKGVEVYLARKERRQTKGLD